VYSGDLNSEAPMPEFGCCVTEILVNKLFSS
jgi:hypothetical protein